MKYIKPVLKHSNSTKEINVLQQIAQDRPDLLKFIADDWKSNPKSLSQLLDGLSSKYMLENTANLYKSWSTTDISNLFSQIIVNKPLVLCNMPTNETNRLKKGAEQSVDVARHFGQALSEVPLQSLAEVIHTMVSTRFYDIAKKQYSEVMTVLYLMLKKC